MEIRRKYALEKGETKRLEIIYDLSEKKTMVKLDGKEVFSFDNDALKKGLEFSLDDGSRIEIRLGGTYMKDMQILRNGRPVLGTEAAQKIEIASYIYFALGGLTILGTLVDFAIFPKMRGLLDLNIFIGIIYFVVGAMIRRLWL